MFLLKKVNILLFPLQHVSWFKTMSCSKNSNIFPRLDEKKEKPPLYNGP